MAKGPTRIAAPKATVSDMSANLDKALKAARRAQQRPAGVRRTKSNNPSRVAIKDSLRIERTVEDLVAQFEMPTAQELLEQTAPTAPAGAGEFSMPTAAELLAETEPQIDRTDYLSPCPSLDPDRPRALESRYNPDTQHLTVVYRNGGTYTYYEVPAATWRALKRNKSFGRTLDRLVINQYAYEKVSF